MLGCASASLWADDSALRLWADGIVDTLCCRGSELLMLPVGDTRTTPDMQLLSAVMRETESSWGDSVAVTSRSQRGAHNSKSYVQTATTSRPTRRARMCTRT